MIYFSLQTHKSILGFVYTIYSLDLLSCFWVSQNAFQVNDEIESFDKSDRNELYQFRKGFKRNANYAFR